MKKVSNKSWIDWKKYSNEMIVLSHPDTNFIYVPIPKNAHTYTSSYFTNLGYNWYVIDDPIDIENKHQIVLLRDPYEKWFSGFSQDQYFDKTNINLDDVRELDKIFDNLDLQGLHTFLQTSFIKYKSSQVTYINVNDDLSKNLNTFILRVMHLPIYSNLLQKGGSVYDYKMKEKIIDIVKNNPKYKKQLDEYLASDLEFYNSVNFYTG